MKELRKVFETEKQYPSWNCNDTVIMEYIEWIEDKLEAGEQAKTELKELYKTLTGKNIRMIMAIKFNIEHGDRVGVIGCKDPKQIIDTLKSLGTDAKAEPMVATQPFKAIYETDGFEEYITNFAGGEKKQTGFVFYCDLNQPK